jgi:methionyl aminopeptidase
MTRSLIPVSRVGVEERAVALGRRSIKTSAKREGIRLATSMIDLTTLEGSDTPGKVRHLCAKAVVPDPTRPELVTERERLSAVTEGSLWAGIAELATTRHLNQVGAAIEEYVEDHSPEGKPYGILTDYVGHGIGRTMHEAPPVFNYRVRQRGPEVKPGLVVAIEPMVVAGSPDTFVRDDEWTVATLDGGSAAHWEHSVAVHRDGIWVLTAHDGGAEALAAFGVTPVRPA